MPMRESVSMKTEGGCNLLPPSSILGRMVQASGDQTARD